ncbi:3-dehydroquinate synthase [Robiginitalea sediminis]|uniref:3-dehydroquinate synthase n=1 Tax=Robiginitalea sediminis TaxID=1982593 RepID=UPI000B4B8E39|nr:3-dehydroquinate synthase [Robiginitalea sediminis]
MSAIKTPDYAVHFGSDGVRALREVLQKGKFSSVFLIVDSNTARDCLPVLLKEVPEAAGWEVVTIPAGESHKQIETCMDVWKALSAKGADRSSLVVNLGGGVVTDLGGFVASTYMRGISFVNIPTSLLAMVDASVGGKTGVDLGTLKNQVGVINQPELVWVFPDFLDTLSARETRSGFAEMLKHGLIRDAAYWERLSALSEPDRSEESIRHSVALKNEVVLADPTEKNLRKILNFGHTLGHAIESHFLEGPNALLHGEAIAMGMILEAYLSTRSLGLDPAACDHIKQTLVNVFGKPAISEEDIPPILALLVHDKKNTHGKVLFTLIESPGKAVFNCEVPAKDLQHAFAYYTE